MIQRDSDLILQRIQIILQVSAIFLNTVAGYSLTLTLLLFVMLIANLVVKCSRQRKKIKQMLCSQRSFYIAYVLTIIQSFFFYKSIQALQALTIQNYFVAVILFLQNINYSLICHPQLTSVPQLVVYSIGIVLRMLTQIQVTYQFVVIFDTQINDDYVKDLNLLLTATAIANSALILDIILRNLEQKQKIYEKSHY